jgi:hypothetical protein
MNQYAPQDQPPQDPNSSEMPQIDVGQSGSTRAAKAPASGGMKHLGTIGSIVIALVVVFGLKFYNKSKASDEVKQEIYAAFAEAEDQTLIRKLIDRHHDRCFDAAYTMGGRRSGGKFDEKKYATSMIAAIEADLRVHGAALAR